MFKKLWEAVYPPIFVVVTIFYVFFTLAFNDEEAAEYDRQMGYSEVE